MRLLKDAVQSVLVVEDCLFTLGRDATVRRWTSYQQPPAIQTAQIQASRTPYTVSQKCHYTLSRHNSDVRELIWIIFGTNVTEKVGNQNVLYVPT